MLVLSRKHGETIMIGEDIQIIHLGTSGSRTRIGICAPADMPIHRQEVFEKLKKLSKEKEKS